MESLHFIKRKNRKNPDTRVWRVIDLDFYLGLVELESLSTHPESKLITFESFCENYIKYNENSISVKRQKEDTLFWHFIATGKIID